MGVNCAVAWTFSTYIRKAKLSHCSVRDGSQCRLERSVSMKPYKNLLFRNRSKRVLRVQIELVLLDSDDVHFICGYVSTLGKLYFFRFRCVRLGEDPMSDVSRKQICETRTVAEREYKVNICWHLRNLSLPDHLQNYQIAMLYGKCQQIYN